jgi:hypothetical protein
LAFDASSDLSVDISEYGGLVVPNPENFVGCGLPEMMTSTKVAMEIKHNFLGFLWVTTPQKHP